MNTGKKRLLMVVFFVAAAAALLMFAEWQSQCTVHDYTDTAMSTVVHYRLYGKDTDSVRDTLQAELQKLEAEQLSWRVEGSDVARLNAAAGTAVEVDSRLVEWLTQIAQVEEDSDGALDITIAPVAELWDIEGENPHVPDETELKRALAKVDYHEVTLLSENQVQLAKDTQIDLGAVGKGIACDVLAKLLRKNGDNSGTISVGGSVAVVGEKPGAKSFQLGIQDPDEATGQVLGVLQAKDGEFISTSGDYEKYFEQDGIRYHHIFDRKTGNPARSGLRSVTIVCDSGLVSDALSTACFVLGLEEGMQLAQKWGAQAVFVDDGHRVYITQGLRDRFTLSQEAYTLEE